MAIAETPEQRHVRWLATEGAVKAYRRMIAAAPARTHALVKLVAAAQYVSGDMYRMSAADHGRMSGFDAFTAALVEAEKALRP